MNTFFQTTGLDPRVAGKQFSGLALLREKIPVYYEKKKKKAGGLTTDFKFFGSLHVCTQLQRISNGASGLNMFKSR